MTIQELDEKYYFHDSMITNISYLVSDFKLIITMEFCNWAQNWYIEGDPELVEFKLIFNGIETYDGIVGDVDYYSILDGEVKNEKYHLFIEDDFHHAFYEYYLEPTSVDVVIGKPITDK